jgi:hypothetical protein
MPVYQIPKYPGKDFKIITAYAGNPLVINGKTGKNKVRIPCRSWSDAERVLKKLIEGDHNGEIHT